MGKPSCQDQQFLFLLGEPAVIGAKHAADVGEGVLLGRERAAVGEGEHLPRDAFRLPVAIAGLAELDEPRVLGEAARVEVKRDAVLPRRCAHGLKVRHGNGLAAAGVVGDGHHDQRDALATVRGDELLQRGHVHAAFEIQARLGVGRFRQGQVDSLGAGELDVGPCRIEVRIVRHYVAGAAHHGEEDALGRAALVGRDHVAEAGEILDRRVEPVETLGAGVGFVAAHHGAPLVRAHGAGAGVGQQVNQNVPRAKQKQVIAGLRQEPLALLARGAPHQFHGLDAEWLDDGLHATSS